MKATEFFKKVGIDAVKSYIAAYEDHLTDELKNLVNAYELVEKVGGLTIAKDFYKNFECVHIGLDLIQCRSLGKAIELVESVND